MAKRTISEKTLLVDCIDSTVENKENLSLYFKNVNATQMKLNNEKLQCFSINVDDEIFISIHVNIDSEEITVLVNSLSERSISKKFEDELYGNSLTEMIEELKTDNEWDW